MAGVHQRTLVRCRILVMGASSSSDVDFDKFDFDSVTTTNNYIDKGSFGEVYGPILWNSKQFALKRSFFNASTPVDDFKSKVKKKMDIWTTVKHKNLIEIHKVVFRPKALYIIMEYAGGGSLRRVIDNCDTTVHVLNWASQIAEGMLYLHGKHIVHRDLKSSNIVLKEPFDPVHPHKRMILKITDFDDVKEHKQTATMSFRGTVAFGAPEVLTAHRFSKASDVWSYGVVLWEILTRRIPYEGLEDGFIINQIVTGQLRLSVPESVPNVYKKLLLEIFQHDQKQRPTFEKIIELLNIPSSNDDGLEVKYSSNPVVIRTIRKKSSTGLMKKLIPGASAAADERKSIRGLTILDKQLFVVSEKSSKVEVYDSTKLDSCSGWDLKELIRPMDIGSCSRNKCLYIFDCKGDLHSNKILRIHPNGKLIKNWSTGIELGYSLSVTIESNVILTDYNKNKLNEYSPDGQLLVEINLSQAGIHWPWHAIKLNNGYFVVSHGSNADDDHRVCMVDSDGRIRKSFGGKCGSTNDQMNRPVYLSVDGNGFVMVADQLNGRVLLLDSNLDYKRILLSKDKKHGLHDPWNIALDESNSRLFVADNESENQRILLFDMK